MAPFIITSYYTLDTPYAEIAHRYLMPSILKLGIKSDIRGVFNLGSWQKNTSYKPKFIKEILNLRDCNVVFCDCDAEILQSPDLFNNIPEEYFVAAHCLDRDSWYKSNYGKDRYELLTGTLFIRNSMKSRELLDEWIRRCENSILWEQKILQELIKEKEIEVYELPLSYCYIATLPNGKEPHVKCTKPVVLHHQASRKYKNLIKGN